MDASRWQGSIWRVWRAGCGFIFGLFAPALRPPDPMGYARSAPCFRRGLEVQRTIRAWRVAVRLVRHHTSSYLARSFGGHLLCWFVSICSSLRLCGAAYVIWSIVRIAFRRIHTNHGSADIHFGASGLPRNIQYIPLEHIKCRWPKGFTFISSILGVGAREALISFFPMHTRMVFRISSKHWLAYIRANRRRRRNEKDRRANMSDVFVQLVIGTQLALQRFETRRIVLVADEQKTGVESAELIDSLRIVIGSP